MKRNIYIYFWSFVLMAAFSSCLENDIPYPTIKAQILEIEARGQDGNAVINVDECTVIIPLADSVNLKSVKIEKIKLTENAAASVNFNQPIDLSTPLNVVLSIYQDYTWTLIARQTIRREFLVEGQIGESIIDEKQKRVIAYVGKNTDLRHIRVLDIQLAPEGSIITPVLTTGTVDFTEEKQVTVTYKGEQSVWTIYVLNSDNEVSTARVDAWTKIAWLFGSGKAGADNGFEIKQSTASNWQRVPSADIQHNGGSFMARASGLKPATSYTFRAYSDDLLGEEITFTTTAATPLENGSLDSWWKNGKVWNPWAEGGVPFWDTGNKGATTLGESNTVPTDNIWPGKSSGKAARLESKFVGVAGIGKFAAGNLFVGDFIRVDGTNGVLNLGKPYQAYPTRLKCYYKYTPSIIDYSSVEFRQIEGKSDTCTIYIALGDWSKPVEIRTKPADRKLFDKNDPNIIAYAEFNSADLVSEYKELVFDLDYRATNRKPSYIIIVCSASKYGDFFTGGAGSVLEVDEFSLEFD